MKHKLLILLIGFYALGWVSVRIFDSLKPVPAAPEAPKAEMITLINEEREKVGLLPVAYSKDLSATAREKSCDMRDRNYFEHQDPQGQWGFHYVYEKGLAFGKLGENIAEGFYENEDTMRGFMESEAHRRVILDPEFVFVGYAYCDGYVTQHFAAQRGIE